MGEANLWVGQRTIRPDGEEKVTGKARFGADFSQPGMLWGKVLRSPHPHARILSIDASRAEAIAGVKAVITGADLVDFPVDTPVQVGPGGHALRQPQRDGAGQGALRRPCRGCGGRHEPPGCLGGARTHRCRVRRAPLGDRRRGRHENPTPRCCTISSAPTASSRLPTHRATSPAAPVSPLATWRRASPKRTW